MGAIIDFIYSSPIPTILALAIAIMLGAGYWFFVFPLLDEVKLLRTKNVELQDNLLEHSRKSTDTLAAMSQSLADIKAIVERPGSGGSSSIEELKTLCDGIVTSLGDIRAGLARDNPRDRANLTTQIDNIDRNIERILRTTSEIGDKQSQVSGIILGLTMQRATPPRGV